MNKQWRDGFDSALYEARANKKDPACPASVSKQWIYRNGEKPFSVTEIETPNGEIFFTSVRKDGYIFNHNPTGGLRHYSVNNSYDLIPYEPYREYEINDQVYGRHIENEKPTAGHFAGLNSDGKPTTFNFGGTSFTRHYRLVDTWNFCEKAAPKEDSSNV